MSGKKEVKETKVCSYDLCKGTSGLKQCKYCKQLFCKNHIEAKLPLLKNMPEMNDKEKKAWDRPGGHLCDEYAVYLQGLVDKEEPVELEEKKPRYETCSFCHKDLHIQYTCESCGKLFCFDHRFPEKHNCKELKPIRQFKKPEVHTGFMKGIIGVIALLFILSLVYISLNPNLLFYETTREVYENITESADVYTSLLPYADNLSQYIGEYVELKGFLLREFGSGGISEIKYFMLDDVGHRVELLIINSDHRNLFPESGVSDDLFMLSGTITKDITLQTRLRVRSLEPSERDTELIVSKILVDETVVLEREGKLFDALRKFTMNMNRIF